MPWPFILDYSYWAATAFVNPLGTFMVVEDGAVGWWYEFRQMVHWTVNKGGWETWTERRYPEGM